MYFIVDGIPRQQQRHRSAKWGGVYDPSAKDKKALMPKLKPYIPKQPMQGALMVQLVFYMPRPKKHYRTGKFKHELKKDAPLQHINKPDGDNLAKLVLDVMENAGFYKNDSQVSKLQIEKYYDKQPRTEIHIKYA